MLKMRSKIELKMINSNKRQTSIFIMVLLASFLFHPTISPLVFAQEPNTFMENLTGEELFIQNRCVRCHTIGRGRFVGPDLYGVNNRYSNEEILLWIQDPQQIYQSKGKMPYNEGYPPMPPMNIPEAQAKAIKDYILSVSVSESAAKTGSISGQVINETNDNPAGGVELTLTSYMGDRATDDNSIKSDEQGNFTFDNLNWDRSYGITVNYKGAQYSTDKMVFFPNEETKILNLPIFEPTVDEDDIKIVESHMIVQAGDEILSVADLTLFDNTGQKIYVGGNELQDGKKESLRFSTPKKAQDANFIHGVKPEDIVKTAYGFADTNSIMPGQKRVVYTYDLPLSSGTTQFEKAIDYPTENFLLMISDLERTANVVGLSGGESVQIQGESFLRWTGTNLKPGHIIKVELKTPIAQGEYLKWGVLAIVLLAVISGAIYSIFIRKSDSEETSGLINYDIKNDRLTLIKQIAFLDDSYQAGQIEKEKYERIRKNKIEELKKLTRRP